MVGVRSFALDEASCLNVLTDHSSLVDNAALDVCAFLDDNTRHEDAVLNDSALLYDYGFGKN